MVDEIWNWLMGRSWIFGIHCECSNHSFGKKKVDVAQSVERLFVV